MIIVLFLTFSHLVARVCLKKGEDDAQKNHYAKTERQLKLLSEDERRVDRNSSGGDGRKVNGNGPDYV